MRLIDEDYEMMDAEADTPPTPEELEKMVFPPVPSKVYHINPILQRSFDLIGCNPDWPDPTDEELKSPKFNAIWDVIKTWDINVPHVDGDCYSGATGNHVKAILDGLRRADGVNTAYNRAMKGI